MVLGFLTKLEKKKKELKKGKDSWLLLGVVEEKVFVDTFERVVREPQHGRVQGTVPHGDRGQLAQQPGVPKVPREQVTEMAALYRKEQSPLLTGQFRVGVGYTSQEDPVTGRD